VGEPEVQPAVTVPVFTDPSGQRRRMVRVIGAIVSVLCVGALVVLAIALAGGGSSPIGSLWAQNPAHQRAHGGPAGHGHGGAGPGGARQVQPSGQVPPGSQSSPSATRRVTASPSPSPSPTKTRKTPPGRYHSKTPRPRPSHSH